MKCLFSFSITSAVTFVLSILAILVIAVSAPGVVQAFGSLSENGTASYMGIGISTPVSPLHVYSTTATQPETIDLTTKQPLSAMWNDYCTTGGAYSGAGFLARYARGTMASPANVFSGDRLGYNVFGGYAGNWFHTAAIEAVVDTGTVSGSSLPTYMRFLTTPDGSTARVERMRITKDGNVGIGTTIATAKLQVKNTAANAVQGESTGGTGVRGTSTNGYGISGYSVNGYGVEGYSTNSFSGYFAGPVRVAGNLDADSGVFDRTVFIADNLSIGVADANSTLQVKGSFATAYVKVTATPYTATASDCVIAVDVIEGAAITVYLPTAVGIEGRTYTVKKVSSGANAAIVNPNGSQEIDGEASKTLSSQWQYITVVSDGANWLITANN